MLGVLRAPSYQRIDTIPVPHHAGQSVAESNRASFTPRLLMISASASTHRRPAVCVLLCSGDFGRDFSLSRANVGESTTDRSTDLPVGLQDSKTLTVRIHFETEVPRSPRSRLPIQGSGILRGSSVRSSVDLLSLSQGTPRRAEDHAAALTD